MTESSLLQFTVYVDDASRAKDIARFLQRDLETVFKAVKPDLPEDAVQVGPPGALGGEVGEFCVSLVRFWQWLPPEQKIGIALAAAELIKTILELKVSLSEQERTKRADAIIAKYAKVAASQQESQRELTKAVRILAERTLEVHNVDGRIDD